MRLTLATDEIAVSTTTTTNAAFAAVDAAIVFTVAASIRTDLDKQHNDTIPQTTSTNIEISFFSLSHFFFLSLLSLFSPPHKVVYLRLNILFIHNLLFFLLSSPESVAFNGGSAARV